jgi:DNA-binding transcriptional LysR family regulator
MSLSRRPTRQPHLDELRGFCTAVDLGSISRAAEKLHLTQPAMSRRLHALEEALGGQVLQRSTAGVRMTELGERVYTHARRVVAELDELSASLDEISGQIDTVGLAISHTAAEYLMSKALVLMHHHCSAPVEVLIANSRVVKNTVRSGGADVGVGACEASEQIDGLESELLIADELVVAVPMSHPWSRGFPINARDLLQANVVVRDPGAHTRGVVDRTLANLGLGKLQVAREVGSTQAAKDEARELNLPTILSRLAVSRADMLEIVPVRGVQFVREFRVMRRPGSLSPAAAALITALHHSAAETRADSIPTR